MLQLQKCHSLIVKLNFFKLHNLEIIVDGVDAELKGANVDDVGVGIFQIEDSCYFSCAELFEMLEVFHKMMVSNMDLEVLG